MLLELELLLLPLVLGSAAAAAGGAGWQGWYAGLRKPSWTPPNWLFGPAWTALYLLMGAAAALAARGGAAPEDLGRFWLQLGLNLLWSFVFFGWRRPRAAFWVALALLAAYAGATWQLSGFSDAAPWLMAPGLLWLLFAAALSGAVALENPA